MLINYEIVKNYEIVVLWLFMRTPFDLKSIHVYSSFLLVKIKCTYEYSVHKSFLSISIHVYNALLV